MRKLALAAWRSGVFALLVLAAPGGATAPAATLRWKFQPGETLHYSVEQKIVTSTKAKLQNSQTTVTQSIDLDWAVKNVGADGVADLTISFARLRTKVETPLGALEYDSKGGKDPEGPIGPLLKALGEAQFTCKLNPQGEMSDIKPSAKLTQALTQAGPAGGSGMFSEDGLKNMVSELSPPLSKDDLAPGKSWTIDKKIPTPPVGTILSHKTFSYQGPDPKAGKEVDKIGIQSKVELQTSPDAKLDIKIQSQDGKGDVLFDRAAGRVAEYALTEKLEMLIKVSMNNVTMELTQTNDQSTTVKLVDGESKAAK